MPVTTRLRAAAAMATGVLVATVTAAMPASAAPSAVSAWITDFATGRRLAAGPAQDWSDGPGADGRTIIVDPARRFQTITGYGAAMTDSSAWLLTEKLDDATRRRAMTALFSPTDGIGLSNLRVPLGASDFAVGGSYTYDDQPAGQTDPDLTDFSIAHDQQTIIPRLQEARQLAGTLNLIGSPWSAPAWMKTNGSLNGGSLSPDYEAAYGRYLAAAAADYAAAGVPLDQLTVQNEPLHTSGSYPTMGMTAEQQRRLITDDLMPALAARGQGRLAVLGYDHNWEVPSYPSSLLDSPSIGLAGTAWHCYGGDVTQQTVVHNAYPDAGTWLTECSGGDWQTGEAAGFDGSLYAVINATREWGQGSLLWNLALDSHDGPTNGGCSNCRGVITVNDDGTFTPTVDYWALAQVSSFVRPGSVRIASSLPTGVDLPNVAFTTPDGDHVLVVHNPGDQQQSFDIGYGDRHLSSSLPAHAAATYRWSGSPTVARQVTDQAVVDLGPAAAHAPSARRTITVDPAVVAAMDQVLLDGHWYAYGGPSSALPRPAGTLHAVDRTGWVASASSSSATDVPQRAIDGQPGTRWSSGAGMRPGDWFKIDLGSRTTLDQLTLDSTASPNDVARRYRIQISDNGTDWTTVARGTGRTGSTVIPLGRLTTRQLRVVNDSSSGSWWSIHEVTASVADPARPAAFRGADRAVIRRASSVAGDPLAVTWNGGSQATRVGFWPGTDWQLPLSPRTAFTVVRIG